MDSDDLRLKNYGCPVIMISHYCFCILDMTIIFISLPSFFISRYTLSTKLGVCKNSDPFTLHAFNLS